MAEVDWILFDADGVVQRTRDGWLEHLTAVGGARGQDFVLAVFAADVACLTGRDFSAAMAAVLREFDVRRPLAEIFPADYWIEVDPEMLAAVVGMRARGLRCALATNQQNLRGAYMRGELGLGSIFDRQFYSYELGYAKPDPVYFRAVVAELAVPAERVLFLDDTEPNVRGASEAGLRAELFPRDGGVAALRPILARHGVDLA